MFVPKPNRGQDALSEYGIDKNSVETHQAMTQGSSAALSAVQENSSMMSMLNQTLQAQQVNLYETTSATETFTLRPFSPDHPSSCDHNAGGYFFFMDHFSLDITPRNASGQLGDKHYKFRNEEFPPRRWIQLRDERGVALPIAVQRNGMHLAFKVGPGASEHGFSAECGGQAIDEKPWKFMLRSGTLGMEHEHPVTGHRIMVNYSRLSVSIPLETTPGDYEIASFPQATTIVLRHPTRQEFLPIQVRRVGDVVEAEWLSEERLDEIEKNSSSRTAKQTNVEMKGGSQPTPSRTITPPDGSSMSDIATQSINGLAHEFLSEGSILYDVWHGKRSLGETFWLWYAVMSGVLVDEIGGYFAGLMASGTGSGFPLLVFLLMSLPVDVWTSVGLWRCAAAKNTGWAAIVKVIVVLGVVRIFFRILVCASMAVTGVPQTFL